MKVERQFIGDPIAAPDETVTRQDIFERVIRHYRARPERCPRSGRCHYRSPGDRPHACFVGPLIEDYDFAMEGWRARDLLASFTMPAWFHEHIDFIDELQTLHDTEANWTADAMDVALEALAARHRLTMPA